MTALFYLIMSYQLGTVMTAYFVGKARGVDLQQQNSGNLGARNAGRTLGEVAFIVTALGDIAKGIIVIAIGRALQLDEWIVAVGMLAVVLGHLYPFWLKGKGGKAVATSLGAFLIFSPTAILGFFAGFLLSYPFFKSMTLGMLVGLFGYMICVILLKLSGAPFVFATIVLVIWKHRENIMERVK